MRALIAILAIIVSAVFAAAQMGPPVCKNGCWEPLGSPPYLVAPQIVMSLAATSNRNFWLGGMEGSSGGRSVVKGDVSSPGGVWPYNNNNQGNVGAQLPQQNMTFFPMAIVGTKDSSGQDRGCYVGVDEFGITQAAMYFDPNDQSWKASYIPGAIFIYIMETISAASASTYVGLGMGPLSGGNQLAISTDYGKTFTNKPLNWQPPAGAMRNCSAPGNIVAVGNTWYLTWGNEPPRNSGSSSSASSSSSFDSAGGLSAGIDAKYLKPNEIILHRKVNGRVLFIKNTKTGAVRQEAKTVKQWRSDLAEVAARGDSQCNFYAGYILKSTDAGATWNVVYETKRTNPTYIACFDDKHCTATSFNAVESYILSTTDGNSFKETYRSPPSTQTEDIAVDVPAYRTQKHVFVSGSQETQTSGAALFWESTDGGRTWAEYPHSIPDAMVVTAMAFRGDVGVATGLTLYKTTMLIRHSVQKEVEFFSQINCLNAQCDFLCQTSNFPQYTCLGLNGGGSAKAECTYDANGNPDGLNQLIYATTSCIGNYTVSSMPVNQCLNSTQGTYFENVCPANPGAKIGGKLLKNNNAKLLRRW